MINIVAIIVIEVSKLINIKCLILLLFFCPQIANSFIISFASSSRYP